MGWDLRNGQCVSCLRGHTDEVLDVAFSNDRFYAATGGADSKACLYDLRFLTIDQPALYGETISSNDAEKNSRGPPVGNITGKVQPCRHALVDRFSRFHGQDISDGYWGMHTDAGGPRRRNIFVCVQLSRKCYRHWKQG